MKQPKSRIKQGNAIIEAFNRILDKSQAIEQFEEYASDLIKYSNKLDSLVGKGRNVHYERGKFQYFAASADKFLRLVIVACTDMDEHIREEYARNYPEIINVIGPKVVSVQNRSRKLLEILQAVQGDFNKKEESSFMASMMRLIDDIVRMSEDLDAYGGYFQNIYDEHRQKKADKPPKSRKDLVVLGVIVKDYLDDIDQALYLPFQTEGQRSDPKQMQGAILDILDDLADDLEPYYDENSKQYVDHSHIQNAINDVLLAHDQVMKMLFGKYTQSSFTTKIKRDVMLPLQKLLTHLVI